MPGGLVRGYTRHLTPVSPGAARTDPLDRGLVGEWRFDPMSGLILPDYSGYGSDCTVETDCSWVTDRYGPALHIPAAGYARTTAVNHLNVTEAISVECFFRHIVAVSYVYLVHRHGSICWQLGMNKNNNHTVGWRINTTGVVTVNSAAVTDVWSGWHHTVATYNRVNTVCYLDGIAGTPTAETNALNTDPVALTIGATNVGSNNMNGRIALVRIYNRALSAAEVRARYEICLKRAQPMTGVWMMPWGRAPAVARRIFITHM